MFDLLVSPFFDSQGGQIKVRFGGTLRVRPTNEHEEFSGTKGIIQIRGGDSKSISNRPDCKHFIVMVAIATDAVSTA